MTRQLASDADIADLVAAIGRDDDRDAETVGVMLTRHPDDPRLHFLSGSILAGRNRPIEAHRAMSRAVELAPDFTLARYQLGFFELTSGEADRALSTWGPLLALPADDYLRVFAEGMTCLIRDEFDQAIERFQHGIALNRDNAPMNKDIHLLIAECRKARDGAQHGASGGRDEDVSATALLLGRFGGHRTLQ